MKKIIFLIQLPPPVHGVSQINEQIFNSKIFDQTFQKSLVQLKFSDDLKELRKFNIKKVVRFCKIFFHLVIKVVRDKPDFIYFSIMPVGPGFFRDIFFVFITKLFRVKPIYHLDNRGISIRSKKKWKKRIYRWVFNNSIIIHLSEGLLAMEILPLGLKNTQYYIIPNGVKRIKSEILNTPQDGFNILFISNLLEAKGVFIVLEAFKVLAKKYKDINFEIAGDSFSEKMDDKIRDYIFKNKLTGRVNFIGGIYGEKKYQLYQKADVFAFPTFFEQECFPLVILEALSFGLPVITTSEGAIPEIIKNEKNGFLINPKNPLELIEKIELLYNNKQLLFQIGKNNRRVFEEKYSLEVFENNLKRVFNSIIEGA